MSPAKSTPAKDKGWKQQPQKEKEEGEHRGAHRQTGDYQGRLVWRKEAMQGERRAAGSTAINHLS
ncbi:hypothetical protein BABINDRAFT_160318 [Babjeviella inositovora NRRL Y-12698]|uniref:Uncharacterized protein n=1 Tax=Babjeviella inositovora NRRL Y-12698 TaxID=984486 RepID=A0A1E3QWX0_9ASCO|nr:uncharacterized protein BABINDRAFT_160318 [Babjeviella inositovora NRRL Y-12698]ODQ82140.1 hypothetical protein BABINDRAFT_160318 [Babjeviella inositovora NRRL Y-12698]